MPGTCTISNSAGAVLMIARFLRETLVGEDELELDACGDDELLTVGMSTVFLFFTFLFLMGFWCAFFVEDDLDAGFLAACFAILTKLQLFCNQRIVHFTTLI